MAGRSTTTHWSGGFTKARFCKGEGVVLECSVEETRVHSVFVTRGKFDKGTQEDNLPTRYAVLVAKVDRAYRRLYRHNPRLGRDEEIDYQTNIKSSKSYVEPSLIPADELVSIIGEEGHAIPPSLYDSRHEAVHPHSANMFELLVDMAKPKAKDLRKGDELRIITLGDSLFTEKFSRLNAALNLAEHLGEAGEALSGGWSGNIMAYAEDEDKTPVDGADKEGVEEEEWGDEEDDGWTPDEW